VKKFVVLLLIVGCSSAPVIFEPQDGPPSSGRGDLEKLPDLTPKTESKSRYGNRTTYEVRGKTYRVLNSAAGYSEVGNASWYGSKFHGRKTSSGEPYDMYRLSAAHKSLPLPTYVRVTNLANGRSAIVRVNDRGPFHSDRIIDLSYAGAVKLGFVDKGTARVRVETVITEIPGNYLLQAGAFAAFQAADNLANNLKALTGKPTFVVKTNQDQLYRVRVGPMSKEAEALRIQALMIKNKYSQPLLIKE